MSDYIFNISYHINNIVVNASYTGYNQDDSVIINGTSLERGCFNTTYYKMYEAEERTNKKLQVNDIFYSPENNSKDVNLHKEYDYSKLDEYGVIKENEYVYQNDVLIGQYSESQEGTTDISTAVKKDGGGLVDKVYVFIYLTLIIKNYVK